DSDRTALVLLDRDTGKAIRKIATPGGEIDRGVFSTDGRRIAGTGQRAKAIRVWDATTGEKVFETPAKPRGWRAGGPACACSPDGRSVVTTEEGFVRGWEVATWRGDGKLPAAAGTLVFSPDGRALACVDRWEVTVWEMTTRTLRFKHKPGDEFVYLPPRF